MKAKLNWDEAKRIANLDREGATRVISYRPASEKETEVYYEWISS